MPENDEKRQHIEYTAKNAKWQLRERFLQIIWNENNLVADLRCTDGTVLRLVSGGIWNNEAGPDFRQALLLMDGEPVRGDVEIHRNASDWFHHGHQDNPEYANVILHVVWHDDCSGRAPLPGLKTLELCHFLLPSWRRMLEQVEAEFYPQARMVPSGSCAVRWILTDDWKVRELLEEAALGRLSVKGQRILRRAEEVGADQAVYEAFFSALGYRHNREAFCQLARETPLDFLEKLADFATRRAVLWGRAGLLPDVTRDDVLPEFVPEVQKYWQLWWKADGVRLVLPWRLRSGRPFNSRERRLEAGLLWLEKTAYRPAEWLKRRGTGPVTPEVLAKLLLDFPAGSQDWQGIRDFRHRMHPAAKLLGSERALDIVLNVSLPFLFALGEAGEISASRLEVIRQVYQALCLAQDNSLIREASRRFFIPPSRARIILRKACHQQGLIALYQQFCLALDNDCSNCPFCVEA